MNTVSWLQVSVRICFVAGWIGAIFTWIYLFGYFSEQKQSDALNVITWAQVIDADFFHDFEKETGIKVNLGYYEHNEEAYAKIAASADHGYDLIMPSDHMVQTMIQHDMLQQIDVTKLTFWPDIYPELKHLYFDPDNVYSVPYYWGFFGLGIDTTEIDIPDDQVSWGLIFGEDTRVNCISVTDDSKELVSLAAQYLFGRRDHLTDEEIEQIKQLLLRQKKHVSLYTDMRPDYAIATRNCSVGTIFIQDLLKVTNQEGFEFIKFVVPYDAKFLQLDSFVIPKESSKKELVYAFLNYLYRPDVLQKYVDRYNFLPPISTVKLNHPDADRFIPNKKLFSNVLMFGNVISEKTLYEVWLALKA